MYQVANFGYSVVLPTLNGGLNVTNGLSTIPGTSGDVTLPANLYYNYPLYWQLPQSFLGDKVSLFICSFVWIFFYITRHSINYYYCYYYCFNKYNRLFHTAVI